MNNLKNWMIAVVIMSACCATNGQDNRKTFQQEVDMDEPTAAKDCVDGMEYDDLAVQLDRFGVVVYGDEPVGELRRELLFRIEEAEEARHDVLLAYDCSELDYWK